MDDQLGDALADMGETMDARVHAERLSQLSTGLALHGLCDDIGEWRPPPNAVGKPIRGNRKLCEIMISVYYLSISVLHLQCTANMQNDNVWHITAA